jgi:hypothetical protein
MMVTRKVSKISSLSAEMVFPGSALVMDNSNLPTFTSQFRDLKRLKRVSCDAFNTNGDNIAEVRICLACKTTSGEFMQNQDFIVSDRTSYNNSFTVLVTVNNNRSIEFENFFVHGFAVVYTILNRPTATGSPNFEVVLTFEWEEEITEYVQ